MVTKLRHAIAVGMALLVLVVTVGRVRVNWTGTSAFGSGEQDPGKPVITSYGSSGSGNNRGHDE